MCNHDVLFCRRRAGAAFIPLIPTDRRRAAEVTPI